ncbi:MAG: hypothetical protein AABX53_00400 [Nanoarchaeota archaeon]
MKEEKEVDEKNTIRDLLYLSPRESISIKGKLSYKESTQAWNIIQLRKEIVDMFPQLKEKRGKFGYAMFYNRSPKELKQLLDSLEKKDVTPILLLLGRVKDSN